jgi:AcrR family transcriptional regulator
MPRTPQAAHRTQAERSANTKDALIDAAIGCLIEHGYAHTTMVEVCARAGVTRGALNHHFASVSDLLVGVLEQLYNRLRTPLRGEVADSLEAMIRMGWEKASRPEFKAVIEIWLAARNDPSLGRELQPAIANLSRLFNVEQIPALAGAVRENEDLGNLYRVAFEAMIGLALGRATSPEGLAVGHEDAVIETLAALAREKQSS